MRFSSVHLLLLTLHYRCPTTEQCNVAIFQMNAVGENETAKKKKSLIQVDANSMSESTLEVLL